MRGVSIGIDVGTTSITTAAVKTDKSGKPRLLAVAKSPSRGVRRGTVNDSVELTLALKSSVAEASKILGVRIKSAVVGFSGAGVASSVSRGVVAVSRADGEITIEDVKRVMQAAEALRPKNPNREIIHMIPRGYRVDHESGIRDPIGMVGMRLEVEALIIDAQKQALQNLVKAFEAAEIEVEDWLFSPVAASEVILSPRQKELGVMLLDIGGGTSDYAIFEEGQLMDAGSIPLGGEHISHDIALGFKTPVDIAEAIKMKYGHVVPDAFTKREMITLAEFTEDDASEYSGRQLAEIIQARMADIFELAYKALNRAGAANRLPAGIVLVGGSSLLPGLREFSKKEMCLPVERGVVQHIELPDSCGTGSDVAVALGLALWHFEKDSGFSNHYLPPSLSKAASGISSWLRIFLP